MTLVLASRSTAKTPSPTILAHLVEVTHDAVVHEYTTPGQISQAVGGALTGAVPRNAALGLQDPQYRLIWAHLEWAARGDGLALGAEACPERTQRPVPVPHAPDLAICWPLHAVAIPRSTS